MDPSNLSDKTKIETKQKNDIVMLKNYHNIWDKYHNEPYEQV